MLHIVKIPNNEGDIINGSEGWLINLIANDTLIPVVFFSLWIITGIIICIRSLRE